MDKLKKFWKKVRSVMIADTFCRYPVIHDEEELKRQRAIAFLKRMYGKE